MIDWCGFSSIKFRRVQSLMSIAIRKHLVGTGCHVNIRKEGRFFSQDVISKLRSWRCWV
jgi:hypothetical protein